MQINFNPRDLTAAERIHVAAFIKGWPTSFAEALNTAVSDSAVTTGKSDALAEMASDKGVTVTARTELVTFQGKTEAELLADEHAADMQPADPEDDNTDKAAAQAAFTPSSTPDRDSEGLPWDRRIHSSSKAINADGRWRIARNVEPELIESVKAELKALVDAPVVAESVAVVPPPPADVRVNEIPPPPTPDLNVMFTTLLRDAGQAVVAQRITSPELTAICVKHGVANVGLLASRKDLVPQIDAEFRALLASKVQP